MSSQGDGGGMQRVLGQMLGREGTEGALDHVPTMPSGTEELGKKLLCVLAP